MAHRLKLDVPPDFTLTMDFTSLELAYGRVDDLNKFLVLTRKLRDAKTSINRIDVSILGNGTLRIKISGVNETWRADYGLGLDQNYDLINADFSGWKISELPIVESVVGFLLKLVGAHSLTDLKYTVP